MAAEKKMQKSLKDIDISQYSKYEAKAEEIYQRVKKALREVEKAEKMWYELLKQISEYFSDEDLDNISRKFIEVRIRLLLLGWAPLDLLKDKRSESKK
ncbi:MAG: hypothetical protein OWQ50_05595 [Acidianus infernus]|nr:hypothetical protein [Acidianus infernus]